MFILLFHYILIRLRVTDLKTSTVVVFHFILITLKLSIIYRCLYPGNRTRADKPIARRYADRTIPQCPNFLKPLAVLKQWPGFLNV
jgi:hypothetical protein